MAHDSEEAVPGTPAGPDPDSGHANRPAPDLLMTSADTCRHDAPGSSLVDQPAGLAPPITPPVARPLGGVMAVPPRPWGFWATMAWSVATMILLLIVEIVVLVVVLVAAHQQDPKLDVEKLNLDSNGLVLAISSIVAAPVGVGLILLLIYARRCPIGEYLGWNRPRAGATLKWAAAVLAFAAVSDALHWLLRGSIVPPWMVEVYETAGWLPLLVFTLLVAAPVFEEVLFRGFMFHGIASSRLGKIPAILITAAAWAAIHVQYDWLGVVSIFLGGILLGIARLQTRSVVLTMLLHSLQNLLATIEVAAHMRMTG